MKLAKKSLAVLMAFAFIFGTMSSAFTTAKVEAASMVVKVEKTSNEDKYGDQEVSAQVAPIIVWAAGVLAAAGLKWLADKLLDMGAEWFCDNYGDYNSVTDKVCDVIG
ncbi:hypothetical protein JOC86_004271 [Bacillus pakistanensis]|uniref:Uncharacterized protein n=1 Tax=Rossellomorea pakistanensis TaxID=992288 RepID=A0ABS2NIM2_9BACI|nr:hypothetical protein [Bacillus pakistanensis]MBM7587697.1 hypothetical protein [Bacillus pakistanensis]